MEIDLQFANPGPDGFVRFVLDKGWTGTRTSPVAVSLRDMRAQVDQLSLDREGFRLDRIDCGISDYADPRQIEEIWKPAVVETVLRVTGGTAVALFAGPNIRFSEVDARASSTSVSAPARAVHSDLAHSFRYDLMDRQPHAQEAMQELRRQIGSDEPKRWRIFNVWQMISRPPQDSSLALCMLPSITPEDYLFGKGYFDQPGVPREEILTRADSHDFDLAFYRHSEAQDWCYFSQMEPGETLIFSGFDPRDDRTQGKVPHSAFDLAGNNTPANPRSSIEIRALVCFG